MGSGEGFSVFKTSKSYCKTLETFQNWHTEITKFDSFLGLKSDWSVWFHEKSRKKSKKCHIFALPPCFWSNFVFSTPPFSSVKKHRTRPRILRLNYNGGNSKSPLWVFWPQKSQRSWTNFFGASKCMYPLLGGPQSHNAFKLILKRSSRFPGGGNSGRPPLFLTFFDFFRVFWLVWKRCALF